MFIEINGYDREKSLNKTKKIYDTTLEILLNRSGGYHCTWGCFSYRRTKNSDRRI